MRVAWVGILATLWVSVAAQQTPSEVRNLLEQRDSRLRRIKLVWQMDLVRSLIITHPEQMRQQAESSLQERLLQELRARGVPPAEAQDQAKQMASQIAAGTVPQAVRFRARYTVERIGNRVFIEGSVPARSPSGWERMTWNILYDEQAAIAAPKEWMLGGQLFSARTATVSSGFDGPWVRVWKNVKDHSAYHRFSRDPLFMTPEIVCLLSGLSPLGMYGGGWQSVRQDEGGWTLVQQVSDGEMAPFVVQLNIDKRRNGAANWVKWHHQRVNTYEHYTVDKWLRHKALWLPARIVDERTTPVSIDRREWVLVQVGEPDERSIEITSGYPVADYRLVAGIPATERIAGKEDLRVAYKWTGRLPDETALRRIREEQLNRDSQPTSKYRFYMSLLPPVLLIAVGAFWYWRLKAKKVA